MCFFPVAVSFSDGLSQVDAEYVHLVRSYGAGQWKTYCLVKIPAAVPALLSGLKVAATYSISGAVVGEWIGSQEGLGYYLLRVKNGYMLDKVFACVAVIIFFKPVHEWTHPAVPVPGNAVSEKNSGNIEHKNWRRRQ